jgi:repressor LexA
MSQPRQGNPLTKRQKQVLRFIRRKIIQGIPPTRREISAGGLGSDNPSASASYLEALEKKGYIKRSPRISRGIRLTELGKEQ